VRKAAAVARGKRRRGMDDYEEEEGGEERDDRRYCVCEELYNPEVRWARFRRSFPLPHVSDVRD
jgi:hypothetical protein